MKSIVTFAIALRIGLDAAMGFPNPKGPGIVAETPPFNISGVRPGMKRSNILKVAVALPRSNRKKGEHSSKWEQFKVGQEQVSIWFSPRQIAERVRGTNLYLGSDPMSDGTGRVFEAMDYKVGPPSRSFKVRGHEAWVYLNQRLVLLNGNPPVFFLGPAELKEFNVLLKDIRH